jgi:hypothetical protein
MPVIENNTIIEILEQSESASAFCNIASIAFVFVWKD